MNPTHRIEAGNIVLVLPIPSRDVSPNAQRGHSKAAAKFKGRSVKVHRTVAKFTCKSALTQFGGQFDPVGYSCRFYFAKAEHTRDDDNADASMKSYRDGICDALQINDKKVPKLLLSTFSIDPANPRVELTIHTTIPVPPEAQELAKRCEAYETAIRRVRDCKGRFHTEEAMKQLFNLLPENETKTENQL